MGFGGGGFSSSPSNVAGPTEVGSQLSDVHQFTGSVDITGSLEINGVQITTNGGGGGATSPGGSNTQVQFNNAGSFAGSANMVFDGTSLTATQVTASTSMKAAVLQVSSSAEGALFRVDHSTQAGAEPILFVSGSGLVGIGTDTPRTDSGDTNRLHIMGESGADQGQDPVVNSCLTLENNDHVGIQFMFPHGKAGQITWGTNLSSRKATHYYSSDNNRYTWEGRHAGGPVGYGDSRIMTMLAGGDSVNIGEINSGHMITNKASLHISSSSDGTDEGGPVLLRVDHGAQVEPVLFVTGSGRVGIGTESVLATLHVSSSTASNSLDLFRVDHEDHADNPIFVVTGSGRVGIGTATPSAVLDVDPDNAAGSNAVRFKGSTQATLFHYSAGEHIYLRGGKTTSTIFIGDVRTSDGSSNQKCIIGNAASTTAQLHVSSSDNSTVMNVTSNSGSILTALENQRVGIGTSSPTATLHVSSSVDAKTLSPFSVQCRGSGSGGDVANDFMFCVTGSQLNQNTVYVGALSGEGITQYADLQVDQNIWLNDGHIYMQGGNPSLRTSNSQQKYSFNTTDSTLDLVNGNAVRVRVSDTLMSSSVAFSSTGMISTANNVEATGSVKGGLFGGTSIETLTSNGAISATTSTTVLNLTAQSNNTLYNFTIADGSFTGQEKKIYAMATSGSSGAASNGIMISGANIRSKATNGILLLSGSMQDFGGGPSWYFTDPQAGASLVWDSAKWLIVGNNNFSISSS